MILKYSSQLLYLSVVFAALSAALFVLVPRGVLAKAVTANDSPHSNAAVYSSRDDPKS